MPATPALDTFPRLLLHHAKVRGNHPATREKDLGIWQTWSWSQVADEVRAIACGLAAQGFGRGHAPRDHRRQPAPALLVDARGRSARRRSRSDVSGRAGSRVRLRAERCRDRVRDRRGPGAGRQARRGDAAGADPRAHLLRRRARTAPLRRRRELRRADADRARARSRESRVLRRRSGQGRRRRRVDHAVHVGHDGQAEGRVPDARRVHRRRQGRRRIRPPDGAGQHPVVPADGVGGRSPLLVRAVAVRRLHHQLPRIGRHGDDRSARDRPDLLLRASARVREPADAGDDPHGGRERDQALAVPLFHGRRAPLRRGDPGRPSGRASPTGSLRARQRADLRAAAQRAGNEQHPHRLYRRRRDRPRSLPLLPLDRRST